MYFALRETREILLPLRRRAMAGQGMFEPVFMVFTGSIQADAITRPVISRAR